MTQSSGRLERAALIAEIVGGMAVVISVIYLALQISDNNRLLRSQSHYNALDVMQRPLEAMMGNEPLAGAIYQCDREPYEVHKSVWAQCFSYYFMLVNGWEYTYYQNLDGTVSPEWYEGVEGYFTAEAESKAGYVRFWKENARGFGEPFRSYVEEHIQINPAMHLPIIE
jgi:hypothetical protein